MNIKLLCKSQCRSICEYVRKGLLILAVNSFDQSLLKLTLSVNPTNSLHRSFKLCRWGKRNFLGHYTLQKAKIIFEITYQSGRGHWTGIFLVPKLHNHFSFMCWFKILGTLLKLF